MAEWLCRRLDYGAAIPAACVGGSSDDVNMLRQPRPSLVLASPHEPNQFLVASTDIRLFEYKVIVGGAIERGNLGIAVCVQALRLS